MQHQINSSSEKANQSTIDVFETPICVNDFRKKNLSELYQIAQEQGIRLFNNATKSEHVFKILSKFSELGANLIATGVIEQQNEGWAMLRDSKRSFKVCADDFYLSQQLIRQHKLRPGQEVTVSLVAPKGRDKYLTVQKVLKIEGIAEEEYSEPVSFDKLTPLFPRERLLLDGVGPDHHGVRIIDLIAPLGKGQRGLIIAPPRGGKTILLKQIAAAIKRNSPEVQLIVLLIDERPEEVTDFEEFVDASVYSSTFDEPSKRHAQLSDLVLQRAKALVEMGKDVVILLDSLTRLARGYNNSDKGGKIMSGGIGSNSLAKPRQFFGAARNLEEGGSLTILATVLVETESRMDDVIFEEFKGTGNMEIRLDRELAERRVFPAIHIGESGTRNDERIYHPDEFPKVLEIRKMLASKPLGDALVLLKKNIQQTGTNAELILKGLQS